MCSLILIDLFLDLVAEPCPQQLQATNQTVPVSEGFSSLSACSLIRVELIRNQEQSVAEKNI